MRSEKEFANMDANAVYHQVLQELAVGDYHSGSRIIEKELATRLGVSRIPLREALSRLIGEGILCSGGQYRGIWLRRYNTTEIRTLYDYRAILESGAVRLAAERADEIDILQLRVIIEKMEGLPPADTELRSELDRRFHHQLAVMSSNDRLVNAINSLLQESRFLFYHNPLRDALLREGNPVLVEHMRCVRATHREIFDNIAAHNPDAAAETVRQHFRQAAENMIYAETVGKISNPEDGEK